MISVVSNLVKDIEDTDPIVIAMVGAALLCVCAWSASIFVSRRAKKGRRSTRERMRPGPAAPPRLTQDSLSPLVEALRPADRETLGADLARLIERHRNKRFLAFAVVTRTSVSPFTFAFLYQVLRPRSRPIAEVHEFQIAVRDASELLKACSPAHAGP
jgi:hypothetical protein